MTGADVAGLVSGYRFPFDSEKDLQSLIADLFSVNEVVFEREARLTKWDIPDFMVGSIAVEVKVGGARNTVLRQMARYATHECVESIVLVTNKAAHLGMPESLNGKPVFVASLLGGAF